MADGSPRRPPRGSPGWLRYSTGQTRLRYYWDRLRSGYLVVPSLMVILAVALAYGALALDSRWHDAEHDPIGGDRWLKGGGPETARAVLSIIAGSMLTVAGIVYSIASVNLTLASDHFGSRLIRTFMADVGTQIVLGAFIATFAYCLIVLFEIEEDVDTFYVPILAVRLSVLLVMASLGLLIYFVHHVAYAIQAPNVINAVAKELERSIRRHFPEARSPIERPERAGAADDLPAGIELEARPVEATTSGYLQFVDYQELIDLGADRDLVVRLEHRPGAFVVAGGPLALVWPGERLDEELGQALRSAFVLGPQRTPPEDVEFSISQLVEVAVRGIGNNDPFTAINCVDRLGAALCLLVGRRMPPRRRYDGEGTLRVVARTTRFEGIVNAAFDQIRQHGLGSAALTIRLLEVIALVASRVDNQADGAALLRQAVMIKRGSQRTIAEEYDQRDIAERFNDILNHLGLRDASAEVDRYETLRVAPR